MTTPDQTPDGKPDKWADMVLEPVPADITTSPEVVRILETEGVEAAREWIAAHQEQ